MQSSPFSIYFKINYIYIANPEVILKLCLFSSAYTRRPMFHVFYTTSLKSDFACLVPILRTFSGVCLSVWLFVCLSRSCIVLKRHQMSTGFLWHTTAAPCLSALKFGLHRPTTFSQTFAAKRPTPVDLSVGDIR